MAWRHLGIWVSTASAAATDAMRSFCRRVVGEGASIDAAFLDPPYNVKINGHANAKGRHREFAMASGEMSEAAFRTFLAETLGAARIRLANRRSALRVHGLAAPGRRVGRRATDLQ